MSISERIHDTLEVWSEEWKDRLGGWAMGFISSGIYKMLEDLEPGAVEGVQDSLIKLRDNENTPPEIKALLDRMITPGHPLVIIAGVIIAVMMFIPMVTGVFRPLGDLMLYGQERATQSFRFDPISVMAVWRRDPEKFAEILNHLDDLGLSETSKIFLKKLTESYPPVPDMVRFADFGSFDPEVIEAWRQFYDAPSWITEPMSLIGIENEAPADWANKYWFSHWVQPGRFELGEMYRRGLLGKPLVGAEEIGEPGGEGEAEETIKLAYRTMGYSSFWQEKLLQLVREIPTRVDVRRWWDMRTIDEAELRSIYQRHGYFGKDLANYVLWTKVYVAFPDLMARWSKGWISLDEVRTELTALGMPAERVEEMIQTKVKAEEPARVEKERALTKTEIYKGVKKGILTWEEGIELLMDLGYDYDEADYILTINVEALAGSPETFTEFKSITQKYRVATGREEKPMPSYIRAKADELVQITQEVQSLSASVAEEEKGLIEEEVLPEAATERLTELRVTLHRAEAELSRIQQEYDALVAEWKHRGTETTAS